MSAAGPVTDDREIMYVRSERMLRKLVGRHTCNCFSDCFCVANMTMYADTQSTSQSNISF